jgi:hypothetical protein
MAEHKPSFDSVPAVLPIARLAFVCVALSLGDAWTAAAQNACPGGPPGPDGLVLKKVSAGITLLDATQEQRTFSASVIPLYDWNVGTPDAPSCGWPYQRTRMDLSASYDGKRNAAGALTVTRNHRLMVQHLMFLRSNAAYAYASGDLTHNNSLGVKFNQAYAGGVGYARSFYEVDADIRFIDENLYADGADARLVGLGLQGRIDIPLDFLLKEATVSVTEQAIPVFNKSDAWMNNAAIDVFLPFTTNASTWGVTVSLQDNYLRNAPTGFKRSYFRTSLNLTYSRK